MAKQMNIHCGKLGEWWVNYQSKQCERIAQEWFSVLGKVDEIPPSNYPTYDLKVDSEKMLIEVTLINSQNKLTQVASRTYITEEMSDEEFFRKIVQKVLHLVKAYSEYPDYHHGGIIFWDTNFDFRQYPLTHTHFTVDFPIDYEIFHEDWDYLILCEEPSIGDRPPAFIYTKKKDLIKLLQKVFQKQYHIMYVLRNGQFYQIKTDNH